MWSMLCFTWDLENMTVEKKVPHFFLIYTTMLVCFVFFKVAHIWEILMGTWKQKNLELRDKNWKKKYKLYTAV